MNPADGRIASIQGDAAGFLFGFLRVSGCRSGPEEKALERLQETVGREICTRWRGKEKGAFREDPVLESYHRFYGRFRNTYHVLRQLDSAANGKAFPPGIPLVSIMFLGELRHRILTAVHDESTVRFPIMIGTATGDERILRMDGSERTLKSGDLFMADREGIMASVLAGPDERTRVTERTTDALYATYVPPGIGVRLLEDYLDDLETMLGDVYPGARPTGRWVLGDETRRENE